MKYRNMAIAEFTDKEFETNGVTAIIAEIEEREQMEIEQQQGAIDDHEPTDLEMEYTAKSAQVFVQKGVFFGELDKEMMDMDSDRGPSFYLKSFNMLKDYRVLCYDKIIQLILYFLGYSKEDINIPKTNILYWAKIRKEMLDDIHFFSKIKDYDFHGPKGEVKSYAMTNFLLKIVKKMEESGFSQEEVDTYNLGFGRLWQWFRYVLDCRVKDILVRR